MGAVLCPAVMSGQTSSREEMKMMVAALNAEMPISMGALGNMESASLVGDSLVMHLNIDAYDNMGIEYKMPRPEEMRDGLKLNFVNMAQMDESFGSFLDYISSQGLWLAVDVVVGDKSFKVALSPGEQQEILTSEPDYKLFIAKNIAQTKESLPIDMGVMKIVDYGLVGNDLVATFVVDESQLNMSNLKGSESMMKDNLISAVVSSTDPTLSVLAIQCAKAGYNIAYKYVGDISKDEVTVTITPSEILSVINQ